VARGLRSEGTVLSVGVSHLGKRAWYVPEEGGRDQVHDDSRGGTEEESSMERTYSKEIKVQAQVKTGTNQV
jgi:hypothetical protein